MATPRRKICHGDISYKIEHHNTVLTVTFNDFENVPCLNEEVSSTIFLVQGESRSTSSKYCNKGESVNFEISPGRDVREMTVIIRLYRSYLEECNISNVYITEPKGLSEVQIPLSNVCFPTIETKPLQALSSAPDAQPKDVTSASHVSHTVERQTSFDKTAHQNELKEVVMNRNLSKHRTKHSDNYRQQTNPYKKPHSEEYDSTEGTQSVYNAKMHRTESAIIVASQDIPDQQSHQTNSEKYGARRELYKKPEAYSYTNPNNMIKDFAQLSDEIGGSNNHNFRKELLSNHDVIAEKHHQSGHRIVDDSESVLDADMKSLSSERVTRDDDEINHETGEEVRKMKVVQQTEKDCQPASHFETSGTQTLDAVEMQTKKTKLDERDLSELKESVETLKIQHKREIESLQNEDVKKQERIANLENEDVKKQERIANLEFKIANLESNSNLISPRTNEREIREKDISLNIKSPPKQVQGIHRQIVKQIKELFATNGYTLRTNGEGTTVVTVVNASRGQADFDRDVKAANLTSDESANFILLRIVPSKDPQKKVDKIKKEGVLLDLIFLADQKATMLLHCSHNTEQTEELVNHMKDLSSY